MTHEIIPLAYPPKTRRVCQPYIDQIAALSARIADAEAALALLRDDLARVSDDRDKWHGRAWDELKDNERIKPEMVRVKDALKTIARGNSLIFNTNPQQMSGEEARGIARAALAQEGGR